MFLKRKAPTEVLRAPLVNLSPTDTFDVRHLLENTSITGQPGSGKTSGSATLARAILMTGASVLVLCAKPDERALWERYCAQTGRIGSLLIFDGKRHRYNFIAAELERLGPGAINGVIELVLHIMESARSLSASARQGGDVFWEDMVRLILRHSLPVVYQATGTISIESIIAFVRSAPRSREEMADPAWQARSFFTQCFAQAADRMDSTTGAQMVSFWRDEWTGLDNKTRSNAAVSLTTTLDRFNHGWLREAFCTDCTMMPELLAHGAVIVLDMPALTHMEDGILAQRLMKFVAQRVLLARPALGRQHAERVAVIWMDEAPVFVDSHDAKFLALCRSSRSCMVLMAQSYPSYYAVMGGENARDRVDQLLSNCATKIWHCNSCPITNKIAADTIGRSLQTRAGYSRNKGSSSQSGVTMGAGTNWGKNSSYGGSSSHSGQGSSSGSTSSSGSSSGGSDNWGRSRGVGSTDGESWSQNETMDYLVEPNRFGMLKTGGPANGYRVEAILYQAGRVFNASGGNALLIELQQS
jgi:uncharacterized membrane protein YgcG